MRKSWVRRVALVGAAGIVAGFLAVTAVSSTNGRPTPLAGDLGCTALGGADGSGTCVVTASVTPPAGGVTVNEPVHISPTASGGAVHVNLSTALSLTITTGSLEMDKNTSIDGKGKSITVTAAGNVTLHGETGTDKCGYPNIPVNSRGAQITSNPATLATNVTINSGDINALPPT